MYNSNQFLDLDQDGMLDLVKRLHHLEEVRRDCTIERSDGIDLDAYLKDRIDGWYANLLLTAPVEWLPVEDIKDDVSLSLLSGRIVVAKLPAQAVRPVEWRLDGWAVAVTQFDAPDSPADLRQRSTWTRARVNRPVIIDHGDRLLLYCAPPETISSETASEAVDGTTVITSSKAAVTDTATTDTSSVDTEASSLYGVTLLMARCVVRPTDGHYRFHTAALDSLSALSL